MVLYEYPFNEGIRTMLRLEHLFARLAMLVRREEAVDHHFALSTLFEIMDVAARADIKSDLLKDLDRHRAQLQSYRGNPAISEAALDQVLKRIETAYAALNQQSGKAGQALTANDWLMSIRSRINIPGGTCEFDLPGYFAWQQRSAERRQVDLQRWIDTLTPLSQALTVLLGLLRESGSPHRVAAPGGTFQQSLPQGRSFQLLRLRIDPALELVPEITGHRLMVSVRLMRMDAEGRLRPAGLDSDFELTLCA
ncbi:cell division protein ZapD [Ideonella livida]|uniref:Cell division protein ZapD n=1 Tax=Ideonella livida TaxID=2707176 RepID=A0A7C9TNM9_9BURK|nr:cell division protein ZapD [Ideonella livida]NDY93705.1 cell division protein ZapD [Ideonella livida]